MKRRTSTAILAAFLILISACATTPQGKAYQTMGSLKIAVDAGMSYWADRVIDGKATPAQEAQVKKAFGEYTKSAGAAAAIMRASTDPAPPDLTNAANALLALLGSFGVVVPGGK